MTDIIVITHGDYGKAMVESSKIIMGEHEGITAFGLHLGESVDELREQVRKVIEDAGSDKEVLLLTDLKSGSPFNVAISLMAEYKIYHVTGVNLPIFMEILGSRSYLSAEELGNMASTEGKETIMYVNKLLEEM